MDPAGQWDKIYSEEKAPQPVDDNLVEIVKFFKSRGVKKILDLACGFGRALVHLAGEGFEVYGLDISGKGIEIARENLRTAKLSARLSTGSMHDPFPYGSDFFDAVLCTRSLNHGCAKEIAAAVSEIRRVLKNGGLVYVTVRKKVSKQKGHAHQYIAPRTYVPLEGREKGVVHYVFNKKLLLDAFGGFGVVDFRIENSYYVFLGKKR